MEDNRVQLQLDKHSSQIAKLFSKIDDTNDKIQRIFIILTILALVIFTQVAPVFWNVPTVIPTVTEGFSILGFQLTADEIEYVTVEGMLKFDEIFRWATMIIEFYFGAQLAKGR